MADVRPLKIGTTTQFSEMGNADTIPAANIDIQAVAAQLPTYVNDAAAITGGLSVGDFYVVDAGNDAIPEGVIKKVL